MKHTHNHSRMVAFFSLFAGLLSFGCMVIGAFAVDFNFEAFSNPVLTLQYSNRYNLIRWFNLLDMFGYYLLLLPLLFYMHRQYKYSSPWTTLFTFSGAAYILVGAIGAAILAAVWPGLMVGYLTDSSAEKESILTIFTVVTNMVVTGMWNILETLFAGVWWIGIGRILYKERKALGIFTMLTGFSTLIDSVGNIFELKAMAEIGLNAYLFFAIIWPVWMAIYVARSGSTCTREIELKKQDQLAFSLR